MKHRDDKYTNYIERLGFKDVKYYETLYTNDTEYGIFYDATFDRSKVEVKVEFSKQGNLVKYRFLKSESWIHIEVLNESEVLADEIFGLV